MQSVSAVIDEIGKKVSRFIGTGGHQGAETQSQPDKYSFHGLFKINDFIAYKDIASPEHTETEKTGEMNRNLQYCVKFSCPIRRIPLPLHRHIKYYRL